MCIRDRNKGEPPGKYSWMSAANIEQAEELFPLTQEDQTAALRLKKGETVISNLIPSHRPDNLYYYAVAVPVFENGVFSGAICGTVNAQSLTGTSLYSTAVSYTHLDVYKRQYMLHVNLYCAYNALIFTSLWHKLYV